MRQHLPGTIIPEETIARLDGAKDPGLEGLEICVDLVAELARTPGVAGVHVMAPGNDAAVPEVLAAARRRIPRERQSASTTKINPAPSS